MVSSVQTNESRSRRAKKPGKEGGGDNPFSDDAKALFHAQAVIAATKINDSQGGEEWPNL